jgi:hypothetical protein
LAVGDLVRSSEFGIYSCRQMQILLEISVEDVDASFLLLSRPLCGSLGELSASIGDAAPVVGTVDCCILPSGWAMCHLGIFFCGGGGGERYDVPRMVLSYDTST